MNEKHWFSIGIALYGAVTLLMAALAVVQALLGNWGVMALCALSAATWAALMAWTVQDWRTLYSKRQDKLYLMRLNTAIYKKYRAQAKARYSLGDYAGAAESMEVATIAARAVIWEREHIDD